MKVYLSGGMEWAAGEGANWRSELGDWIDSNLGHAILDPVVESNRIVQSEKAEEYRSWKLDRPDDFKSIIRKLIANDIRMVVEEADYIICLWNESVFKGGGTHGEVTLAYHYHKPVYLVNKIPIEDMSGWIFSCSTELFPGFDELKEFLLKKYNSESK